MAIGTATNGVEPGAAGCVAAGTERDRDAARVNGLPDVQASADARRVAIDRVGVKAVSMPLLIRGGSGGGAGQPQRTVATVDMYVSLSHDRKGTHMSRFVEILHEKRAEPLDEESVGRLVREVRERLDAQRAELRMGFTYFIDKPAPVTGQAGLMNYDVEFLCSSEAAAGEDVTDFVLSVAAPATSLCPCSKEISAYGAHNQRCRISAAVRTDAREGRGLSIEELVAVLEGAATHPVYSVLKRPDEQFVTERAYENPKFVEDIIRDLAGALNREERVVWYAIDSENFESIHSHNAYAAIERDKRG